MDFFKSIFSATTPPSTTPTNSPPHTPKGSYSPSTPPSTPPSEPNFFQIRLPSLLDNYYRDLQEFTSALKNDTSILRQAASRAVQDLPARLESGAAFAQESLEAVGEAIDNVGSTFSGIIRNQNRNFDPTHSNRIGLGERRKLVKPYSRLDAIIRGLQCDVKTYGEEVEQGDYAEWELGFRIGDRREEIGKLVDDSNGDSVVREIFNEVLPEIVDENTFWCRYFYRVDKVIKTEEARLRIVKKACMEEEEELTWDVEDDVGDKAGVSGTKEGSEDGMKVDEKEGSEGKVGSDYSVISSRRSSHVSDFSWDEMEDGLQKQSTEPDGDEELSWDVEDEDQTS